MENCQIGVFLTYSAPAGRTLLRVVSITPLMASVGPFEAPAGRVHGGGFGELVPDGAGVAVEPVEGGSVDPCLCPPSCRLGLGSVGTEELARASRPTISLHCPRNGTEFPRIRAVSLEAHPQVTPCVAELPLHIGGVAGELPEAHPTSGHLKLLHPVRNTLVRAVKRAGPLIIVL